MRKFAIATIIITVMALGYAVLLIRISRLEAGISVKRNKLTELQKEIDRKKTMYEERADIEGIANEMQTYNGMEISNDIKYFTISGNSDEKKSTAKETEQETANDNEEKEVEKEKEKEKGSTETN